MVAKDAPINGYELQMTAMAHFCKSVPRTVWPARAPVQRQVALQRQGTKERGAWALLRRPSSAGWDSTIWIKFTWPFHLEDVDDTE